MAGYIGKSLATGGTAVDAYSKTQGDARYVDVAGDTMTGNLTMTGGVRQGILSVSTNTTITTAHPNVILVTTGTSSITMTLPSASTVGGQVYRFMKVDSGGVGSGDAKTGIVIIARAGSDTMGINANLTMELWFQDNYVDLMSDGVSRWIVVSTEVFNEPIAHRATGNANPHGATTLGAADGSDPWNELNYGTGNQEVPAGTSHIKMFIVMYMPGEGASAGHTHNGNLYFRPKGSTRAVSTPMIAFGIQHEGLAIGHSIRADGYLLLECDIARKIEYYMIRDQGTSAIAFYMHTHGYRLG